MALFDLGLILAGLVLLVLGGESLVRGAVVIGRRAGISALVVGLTVVSAATSAPELAVTVGSVLRGEPGLAVGNVVGSNIANVLLILGIAALVTPLAANRQLVKFDVPVLVAVSAVFLLVSLDGRIGITDALILIGAVVLHVFLSVAISRRETRVLLQATGPAQAGKGEDGASGSGKQAGASVGKSILLLLFGVALLVVGASLLVDGAVSLANSVGVSSLVVGLTVVAIGTSLPELATSVIAVRRGERDLAVGNAVGSCIFNIGIVLGLPALIFSDGIPVPPAAVAFDMPVMVAAALALLPIVFTGFAVARWEGSLFLAMYAAYTGFVVLQASEHDALEGFSLVMVWFVLPLIAVTLIALTAYEIGLRRGRRTGGNGSPSP